jgi:hypothetical protein
LGDIFSVKVQTSFESKKFETKEKGARAKAAVVALQLGCLQHAVAGAKSQ